MAGRYLKTEAQKELGRRWLEPQNRMKLSANAAIGIIRSVKNFRPFTDMDYKLYPSVKGENALYGSSEYHTVISDNDELIIYDNSQDSPEHLYVGIKLAIKREKEKDAESCESKQEEPV